MTSRSETTIECNDSTYDTYMVTISSQQKKAHISVNQLDSVVDYLSKQIDSLSIIQSVYENTGHYQQLHYHAIVNVPKDFRYYRFTKYGSNNLTLQTYSINWGRVYNLRRAITYLNKDLQHQSQQDIIQDNGYKQNCFNLVYND